MTPVEFQRLGQLQRTAVLQDRGSSGRPGDSSWCRRHSWPTVRAFHEGPVEAIAPVLASQLAQMQPCPLCLADVQRLLQEEAEVAKGRAFAEGMTQGLVEALVPVQAQLAGVNTKLEQVILLLSGYHAAKLNR